MAFIYKEGIKKDIGIDDLKSFSKKITGNTLRSYENDNFNNSFNDDDYDFKLKRQYTLEQVNNCIERGTLSDKIKLSKFFFNTNGYYRRTLIYYATISQYKGVIIPLTTTKFNTQNISAYNESLKFLDRNDFSNLCIKSNLEALISGTYYGLISTLTKTNLSIIDLPSNYCRTRFKDENGNDVIEFNLRYFSLKNRKKDILPKFPTEIQNAYNQIKGTSNYWYPLDTDYTVCFQLYNGMPPFLDMIPSIVYFQESNQIRRKKDLEEIKKLIIQKIPHLTNGDLLFEPIEAKEIHNGTVDMLKKNSNLEVLTTYADVEVANSNQFNDSMNKAYLEVDRNNIFASAGVSGQLFASSGNLTISNSIQNDLAFMTPLINKNANFITTICNRLFGNSFIFFKYIIFNLTHYNEKEFIENSLKLANNGYSYIIPAIALGINQNDLSNLKDLENDVLNLGDKLKPLQSSYTQSGKQTNNSAGAPEKDIEDLSPNTTKR